MGSRLKWSKRNDIERGIQTRFERSRRKHLYSEIEEPKDPKTLLDELLKGLSVEQRKLVALVHLRDNGTIEEAIAVVKGDFK